MLPLPPGMKPQAMHCAKMPTAWGGRETLQFHTGAEDGGRWSGKGMVFNGFKARVEEGWNAFVDTTSLGASLHLPKLGPKYLHTLADSSGIQRYKKVWGSNISEIWWKITRFHSWGWVFAPPSDWGNLGRNLAGIVAALSAIIPCGLPYNRSGPPLSTRNHGAPEDQTTHPPTRPRPHQRVRTAYWAVGQPHLQLYTVPYFYKRKISLHGCFLNSAFNVAIQSRNIGFG